ncbi:MAG: sterol desaturase family protein [Deltaproteobacteria bacterium]|nr:sterol desaturase family protein [Deltaproteobacteria bacterium]
MTEFVTTNEAGLRIAFFVGIFLAVALVERVVPRRVLTTSKKTRWFGNIGIVFINTFLLRLLVPAGAVGVSVWIGHQGWGIFNYIRWPFWLEVALTVVILDFIIYMQHVMFHAVPVLWRLHMMHHADLDYDLTTGTRFHPLEIIISLGIKAVAITVLGAPPVGVIVFEILLNGTAMFNHGNFFIPLGIDRVLRLLVVTPDMHRVHHSVFPNETNTNFGFNLPWWDRLCGTYRSQPRKGHEQMTIGLNQFRDPSRLTLPWLLALPFIGTTGSYAIGKRGAKSSDDQT